MTPRTRARPALRCAIPRLSHTAIAILAGVLALGSSSASADALRLVRRADGALECASFGSPCVDATGCPASAICTSVGTSSETFCHFGVESFLCCEVDADCQFDDPAGGVVAGVCLRVATGVAIGGDPTGVCSFPTRPGETTFCGVSTTEQIAACLTNGTLPGGTPIERWGVGNCDGDGTTNGAEATQGCDPCDPASIPPMCAMRPDAGSVGPDAGRRDAGDVPFDAGAVRDAGDVPFDAGAVRDSGGVPFDAAAFDARPPMDGAGTDTREPPSFHGGGGCVCEASSPRRSGGSGWIGALGLLALPLLRRR